MNFEAFKTQVALASEKAQERFDNKVAAMEFFVNGANCTTFVQLSGPIFQWYWFDGSTQTWKETHILHGENWLKPTE